MPIFYYAPYWFYGIDSILEIVTVLVGLLVFFAIYKLYKYSGEKKSLYFALSFLLISVAYFFKIISNLVVYQEVVSKASALQAYSVLAHLTGLHAPLFILYRFCLLLAFVIMFLCVRDFADKRIASFLVIFVLLFSYFSVKSNFFYHMTLALLVFYITMSFYDNYKLKKKKNAQVVTFAFLFILFSQLIFASLLFFIHQPKLYAIGEVIQLVGYFLLLINYFTVLKK